MRNKWIAFESLFNGYKDFLKNEIGIYLSSKGFTPSVEDTFNPTESGFEICNVLFDEEERDTPVRFYGCFDVNSDQMEVYIKCNCRQVQSKSFNDITEFIDFIESHEPAEMIITTIEQMVEAFGFEKLQKKETVNIA